MARIVTVSLCVQVSLLLVCQLALAGENGEAVIALSSMPVQGDSLPYRVLVGGATHVKVVHLEFSYDPATLAFLEWRDADFLVNFENSLRVGPKLDDRTGIIMLAIASHEFMGRSSFEVGAIRFLRSVPGNAEPKILRASLVDQAYQEDWIVMPAGGGQAPPAPLVEQDLPLRFALRTVTPNPMMRESTVKFEIPRPGAHVKIKIYDVTGRETRTVVDEHRAPGYYSEVWDLTNDAGHRVAPGIYFCRMEAGHFRDTKKVVLLR